MKNVNLGYIYVSLSAFFFAVMSIVGKCAFNKGLQVFDLLIMQNAVSVLGMLVYLWFRDKRSIILTRNQLKNVIIQGVFGSTTTTILYYLALQRIGAGVTAVLIFIHPVFVTLFFILTKMRPITWVNNLALIMAVSGSAMALNVFGLQVASASFAGIMFGLFGSITYAFYNVYADLRLKDINPEVVPLYTSAAMLVVSSLIHPGFFRFDLVIDSQTVVYVFELAIITGILPVIFLYKGLALIGSEKVSIIATAELPLTLILAFLILNESMVFSQLIGVILITGAILVLQSESALLQRLTIRKKAELG
jgi:drug/metabolite transporter (DMT)-like permease